MNPKTNRIIAIIALVFVSIATIALIMYMFDTKLLNGAVGSIALWSGGIGLLLYGVLWLNKALPGQKDKYKLPPRPEPKDENADGNNENLTEAESEKPE